MVVLDIDDHLKHRRRITEENHEYTLIDSESDHDDGNVSEAQPNEQPARQQRKHKPRNTNYYLKTPGLRPKGSRSGRRYENTCYLLSLVDHQDINELELPDIVNTTMTIFSTLFEDPQKMKVWNEFTNLPEEDQIGYLRCQTTTMEEITPSECTTCDMSRVQPTEQELYAVASKSYYKIDKKIRGTFQKKRFALGGLELLEDELLSCLSSCPEAVLISNHPSSLDRMMVHALCQYSKLLCTSHNFNGKRLMEIETDQTFQLPSICLSQYIKHKVLS